MSRLLPLQLGLLTLLIFSPRNALAGDEPAPADNPLFSRHVAAVFSRLGCNGGTCHGAVKRQNGFRLSLFGADPAQDYERLLREYGGRRLNFNEPDASLLLQKATAEVAHQGGKRMTADSPDYQVIRRWIAAGAPLDPLPQSRVVQMQITPAEQTAKPGERYRLQVSAKFADGTTENITALCSYQSLDRQVATVTSSGEVTATGVGDAALIVRYRAAPAMALIVVPRPSSDAFPEIQPNNFVDRHILAKLRRLNIPPAEVADDYAFLRRASLDVTGELPAPKEIRAFLEDKNPAKRARKIEELLARPGYAALWTLKFCDLLKANDFGVYADGIKMEADAPRFQQWIRARLQENVPYDQFVERILTATSREGKTLEEWNQEVVAMQEGFGSGRPDLTLYANRQTLDLYWQRGAAAGVPGTLQIAHAFLGLRLECAQCHRHPHDIWQQDDLLSFANFFNRVRKPGFQGDNEKKFPDVAAVSKQMAEEGKKLGEQAKKMRETELKKLDADAKQAKVEADKLRKEIAATKDEAELAEKKEKLEALEATIAEHQKLAQQVADMERRSKLLPECGTRMLHAEIRHVADSNAFASVTSPLGTQTSQKFRLLGQGEAVEVSKDQDPRALVAAWMRRPDNPYFARAIVNRVWAHYFGRGIVDPPDNLSSFNPASHPELLKELADQFVKNSYDLKWLHRTILQSRTYQQSSQASAANEVDHTNYAYFYYRRLPAEVMLDSLNTATGVPEKMDMQFQFWPGDMKTVEIPFAPKNLFVNFMLEQFGRPKRNSAVQCDCERDANASVLQVLSFANHPRVWAKISDPTGQVARIVKDVADDGGRIEEVFLCTLSRTPSDAEREACVKYLKECESPTKGLQGILWSLVNTREFLLQH